MRVVVAAALGRFPVGGHAWADLNLILGLLELGCDVWYLEDAGDGSWVWDWEREELTNSIGYPATYVRACLRPIGMEERWHYRAGDEWDGCTPDTMADVLAEADLLLIRGAPLERWRPEYDLPRRRAFIDVDPGFTQGRILDGDRAMTETVERCERLFTIANRIGAADCLVPNAGRTWFVTRPPVSVRRWVGSPAHLDAPASTILQWKSYRNTTIDGVVYGNKDWTFPDYIGLPRLIGRQMRVALTGGDETTFRAHGWDVVTGWRATLTPTDYVNFVTDSQAEFGVAKHGYVAMRSGWFSDRSVCYLASGRPVIVQDTGLTDWLPVGQGIHVFSDPAGAARALDAVHDDLPAQGRLARSLAEDVFAADEVARALLEVACG